MPFCTEDQVRAIVDTDITDSELIELIEDVDAQMILTIAGGGPNVTIRRSISRIWTAYRCMLKDPDAQALGEYSQDRGEALGRMKDELDVMIKAAGGGIAFTAYTSPIP